MHFNAHLHSAAQIINAYDGAVPFALWLKNHFRQHKKFGSKDRKAIADLCFCYFRLGKAFLHLPVEDRLLAGQFLCHAESPFVTAIKPEWANHKASSIEEKISFLGETALSIFPFGEELSTAIDPQPFSVSFLQQPDLFLRLRPGRENRVLQKLANAGIQFRQEGTCLRLANNTKADEIISLDEEAVVQDRSSQQVLEALKQHRLPRSFAAWDCCAASGGKTILLHDAFPQARLTVSDIRESILHNLRNRLRRAGIVGYRSFVADVSAPAFSLPQTFDVILCDAPCSGSGTWGRTPEQMVFFTREKIHHYSSLQKRVALNASRNLKKGGLFLYITCSVFTEENEAVVSYLQQAAGLQVLSQQYFTGYEQKADTLFAALLTTS